MKIITKLKLRIFKENMIEIWEQYRPYAIAYILIGVLIAVLFVVTS